MTRLAVLSLVLCALCACGAAPHRTTTAVWMLPSEGPLAGSLLALGPPPVPTELPDCVDGDGVSVPIVELSRRYDGQGAHGEGIAIARSEAELAALVETDPAGPSDEVDFGVGAVLFLRLRGPASLVRLVARDGGVIAVVELTSSCGGAQPAALREVLVVPAASAAWARIASCDRTVSCGDERIP